MHVLHLIKNEGVGYLCTEFPQPEIALVGFRVNYIPILKHLKSKVIPK